MAPLWKHPEAALFQICGLRAALSSGPRARGRHRQRAEPRHEVRGEGFLSFVRTARGEIQWEGDRSPPPLVVGGWGPGEGRIETPFPWGFRGVLGGLLWPQSSPPKFPPLPPGRKRREGLLVFDSVKSVDACHWHAPTPPLQRTTNLCSQRTVPLKAVPCPWAENPTFHSTTNVQHGTTILTSRKCQTLAGHCPARVCCIMFHVKHRRQKLRILRFH